MDKIIETFRRLFTENKNWLRIVNQWFIASVAIGAIAVFIRPDLLEMILDAFSDKFGENPPLDFDLAMQIFLQNITVSLLAIFGGLLLGIGPFVVVIVNGFLIGYVVFSLIFLSDASILQSLLVVIAGLAPHGVLEIPAFLVAAAVGLRLGIEWVNSSSAGSRFQILKRNFINCLVYLPAIAAVLFLAALIEVYVTGWIVNNL